MFDRFFSNDETLLVENCELEIKTLIVVGNCQMDPNGTWNEARNNNETTTRCNVWYWKMHVILLMVQKSCTSWGWQFLPLCIGFYTSKRWLLGIPAPSTVVESFRPEALQFLAPFQGYQATAGRKLLDMRRRRRWRTDEDEDEVKLGWISGV